MLSNIDIRNFQSLHHINIELAPFTVIVGPSSSGKSAFTRAVRTLTSNARGDGFITHGERTATITATTDKGTAVLQRGAINQYTLIPHKEQNKKTFTKLGGAVPEEVTEFIGIAAKDPINYANQFDMPYLLSASAGDVARTLGELTNVQVIFEAAREANRRRNNQAATLKVKAADYKGITEKLEDYKALKGQLAAIASAEKHITQAATLETRISKLTELSSILEESEHQLMFIPMIREVPTLDEANHLMQQLASLKTLKQQHEKYTAAAKQPIPVAPSLTEAQSIATRYNLLTSHIKNLGVYKHAGVTASLEIDFSEETRAAAQQEYTEALEALGTCPTCHQSTKGLSHGDH